MHTTKFIFMKGRLDGRKHLTTEKIINRHKGAEIVGLNGAKRLDD
jgi:hypothetical protein